MLAACAVALAAAAQAASVGWTNMGLAAYNGDKYQMFVIGQKGVTDVATITALLDAGTAVDSYAIGGSKVANGFASLTPSAQGPQLGEGTYTAFMVLFDAADPVSGTTKYAVLQGASGYTQTVGPSSATVTFLGGNAASMITGWNNFGPAEPVPEPTSAMLMLLGVAGIALKRKRA